MGVSSGVFPLWWWLTFDGLALLCLGQAVWRFPWARWRAQPLHVWFAAGVLVMVLWALRDDFRPGLSYHLLGMTILCLMMGPRLALLLGALVVVGAVLGTGGGWLGLGWLWCGCVLLPVGVTQGALWLTRRTLPANYFVYLFLNAFLTGALAMVFSGTLQVAALGVVGTYPWGMLLEDALPYYLLLAWSEAFLSGLLLAIMIVYKPHWVASFDDASYLHG